MKNFRQYFVLKFFREEKFKTRKIFVKSLSDENFSMTKKSRFIVDEFPNELYNYMYANSVDIIYLMMLKDSGKVLLCVHVDLDVTQTATSQFPNLCLVFPLLHQTDHGVLSTVYRLPLLLFFRRHRNLKSTNQASRE